ncbi:mucin-22-like isoform X2 [Xiphophorus hellerii]|uniref:mucin-22-like isoform X2 n=1 Tax=Xiphophorus hellerii TaxID=8084 RepID=UPI0013B3B02D|nr:mucin-22-like isoform X2 [Xiphophorus hellerii]
MSLFTTRKSSTSEASTTQPSTAKQTVGSTMTEANKDRGSLTASTRQTVTTLRIVTITESNPSTTANQASITNQTSTSMVNVKAIGLMTTSSTSVTSKTEGTVQLTSTPPPLTTRSTTGTEAEIPTSKKSDKISSTQSTSALNPLHVTTETQTAATETGSSTTFKQAVSSTYSESVSDHNRSVSELLQTLTQNTDKTTQSQNEPTTTPQPLITGSTRIQENTNSGSDSFSTIDRKQTTKTVETVPIATQTDSRSPTITKKISTTTAKQPAGSVTQTSTESGSISVSARLSTHSTQPAASKILNISATIDLSYITETLTVAKQTMADQNERSQTVNESLQSSTLKSKTQDRPSPSAADNSGSSTSAAFPTEQYKAIGSTTVQTNTKSESILMSTRLNTQMAADVQTETSSVSKNETQASTTNTDTSTQMVMSKATIAKQTTTTVREKDVSGLVSMSPETGTTSLSVISSTSVTRQFTKLSNATQTTTKTDKGTSLKTPEPITLNLTPTSQTRAAEITKTTEFETLHEMESTSIALTTHQPTATKHATGSATGQVTTYGGSVPLSTKQTVGSGTTLHAATQTLSSLSTNATPKSTTDHETTNIMESMLTQGGLVSGQNGGESMESMATAISPTSLTLTARTSVKATSLTPSMTIKPTTNTVEKAQLQNTSEKITLNVKGEAQTTDEQMTKTPAKIESFTTSKETKGSTKGGLVVTQTQTINTVYGQQQISTQISTLRTPSVDSQETSSSAVTKSEKPTTSAPLTTQQTAGTTTTNGNTGSRLDSVSSRPTTQTAESDKHANSNSITTSASSATSTTGANGKSTVSTLSASRRLTSSVVANTQEYTENTKLPTFSRQSTQNVTTKIQTPEKETSITPETTKADTQDETKTLAEETTEASSTTRSENQQKMSLFTTRKSSTSEASTTQPSTAKQTVGSTMTEANKDRGSLTASTRQTVTTRRIVTITESNPSTTANQASITNQTSTSMVNVKATGLMTTSSTSVTSKTEGTVQLTSSPPPLTTRSTTGTEAEIPTSKKSDKISSTQSTSALNPLHVTTETQTAATETGSSTAFKQAVSSTYSESVSDHNRSVSELLQTLTQNTDKTTQSQNEPTTTPQPLITGSTRIQENTNSGSDSFSTIDRKQTTKTVETVPIATQTDSRSPTIIKKISTTTAKQPAGSVTQTSTESGSISVSARLSTHSTQPAASKILNISATIDLSYITETLTVAKQTMADQNERSQTVNESLQSSTLKSKTQDRPSPSAADNSGSSTSAAFPTEQHKAIGSTTVQTNTKSESILMSTRLNTQMAADVQTETSSVSKNETQASTTNTDTSTQMVMSKATTAKQITTTTTTTTIRGKDVSGLVSMSPETGTTSLSVISSTSVTRQFTKLSNATQTTTKTDKGTSLKTPEPITLNLTPTTQTRAAEITKTTEFETLHEMESTSIALTTHQPTATKHATGSATGQVTTYGGSVPMSTKQTVGSGTTLHAATQTLSSLSTNATPKSTTDHETTNIMESMLTQGGLVSGQNGGEFMESMATAISPTSLTSTARTSVKATSLTPSMTIKPTTNTVEKAQLQNTSEKITLNVKGEAQTTDEQMTKTPAKIESFTTSKETKGSTKGGLVVTQTQTINTVYGQQQISTQISTLRTPSVDSQETSSSAVTKSEKPTTSAPLTTQQTAGTTTTNGNTDSRLDSVSSRPTTQTAESDKHANSNSITTSASSATSTTGANGKSTVSTLSASRRLTSSVVANTQEYTENTKLPTFSRQSTQNVTTKIQTPEKETSITPETTKADTQDETKTLAEETTEASSTTRSENQQKMSLFTTRKSSTSEASTTQPSTAKQTVGSTMTEANKDRGSLTASTRQTVTTLRIVTITESNPSTTANQASITNQTSTSMVNVKAIGLMTTSSTSVTSKTEGTVQLTSTPPPLTTRSTTGTEAEIPTSKKSDKISSVSTQSTSALNPLHVTTETQTAAAETGSSTAFKQAVVSTYSESVSDHNRNKSTSLQTSSQKTGGANESEDQTKDASPATNKSEIPKTQQPPIIGSITVQENTKSKSISLSTFDRRQTEHNGTQTNYTPPTTINQMSITTAKHPVGSTTTQGSVDSGSIYMSAKKSSITPATTKSNTQDKATSSATTKSQTTTTAAITGKQPTTTKQTVSSATTASSRTSTITAHAVTNTNYDTSLTTGQISPTASTQSIGLSNQSPTQVIEKTTGKQEAGRTTGHMGTTVNTTPHTTASLVTSPQETTQTAAHTITPEEEPETASAWTADQYSSTLQSLESSSSQQPQSVSLVPVSTLRSTSASVPAQSSSHSTTEEAHSSTSPQVNGTTNMEKATVKSTAAEYGSADTTDSKLYTSSANIRHANTTQLEYDASPLPVSRNRTVFFKYSPRVVIVKPLVFDYPVVERITFLSNDTDKIDGMTN